MPQDNTFHIAIVGGGAAGLAAAISAAQKLREIGEVPRVAVFEAADRVGKPILVTGNGRCNFSNSMLDISHYHNASFVDQAIRSLIDDAAAAESCAEPALKAEGRANPAQEADASAEQTPNAFLPAALAADPVLDFFHSYGLMWRKESEGRLYPLANKASSVVDVLRNALKATRVTLCCNWSVTKIEQDEKGRFHLWADDGRIAHADTVILACGGRWLEGQALLNGKTGLFNLPAFPQAPVLGPLKTDTAPIRGLDNIRVKCTVSLLRDGMTVREGYDGNGVACCENGEVLFRTYGVSGIAIFNLSRYAQPGDIISLDLIPEQDEDELEALLLRRRKRLLQLLGNPTAADYLDGMLLPQVASAILKAAGISATAPLAQKDISQLVKQMKSFQLTVAGLGDEKQCQVRRGGLDVAAFNPRTLEALSVPGLFACGEALDVDGPCGGYNLHWAWASGILCGQAASQTIL